MSLVVYATRIGLGGLIQRALLFLVYLSAHARNGLAFFFALSGSGTGV